ncbi:energy-coupling factor ABC transporter ATP-binding protein [uncultured Methanoregula sp.]|uniref:energy-coupling factor ABC transporter ATP-binding protein n=1 Tax=uncultured Methanoregula sp. TaxID=1005933 RepID=UPI002AAB04D3|nr:energy-coupling factor ABC transporter ATP-binding protein [uncultured Methanoregula sp.]
MIRFKDVLCRNLSIDSLIIPEGITSVIGMNGSGKTTLLKTCAGIHLPERGTIFIDGTPPRETETGWVNEFPDRNLLFNFVSDEIASSLRFRQIPCNETEARVTARIESMGILHLKKRLVRELSGGEKILVALGAALVCQPSVLVLDEYDSHLDAKKVGEIEEIIRKSRVPYVIRSTQQMETAALGDYVIFLENGSVKYAGTPDSVFPLLKDTSFYPFSWRIAQ